jgi:hypothetical protein
VLGDGGLLEVPTLTEAHGSRNLAVLGHANDEVTFESQEPCDFSHVEREAFGWRVGSRQQATATAACPLAM